MLQEAGHIKNINVLIFRHIQCLHLMYAEVAWLVASSGTQIILDSDYLPGYLPVSFDYGYWDLHSILPKECMTRLRQSHRFVQVSCRPLPSTQLYQAHSWTLMSNVWMSTRVFSWTWTDPVLEAKWAMVFWFICYHLSDLLNSYNNC